jgi:hypothetical protein
MLKNITLYIPLHTANVMSDCPRATQNPETFVMQRNLVTRPCYRHLKSKMMVINSAEIVDWADQFIALTFSIANVALHS